jgi:hypothetical protein
LRVRARFGVSLFFASSCSYARLDSHLPRPAVNASEGILADHLQPRRNRGRKPAKNEGDVFSLLKRDRKALYFERDTDMYNPKSWGKINWSRVLGCGLLAGIVWIVLGSGVTTLLGRDFAALPNNNLGKPTTGFLVCNVVLDLLEGISIVWLYAAIRPLYRPCARAAVIAAFAWWFIVSLGGATWRSFGFFPPSTVIPP